MKLLAAIAFLAVATSQLIRPYHKAVGVPQASRLRRAENGISPRISGGHDGLLTLSSHMGGLVITLESNETSVCGSSLLTNTKSLTAAHCWYDGFDLAVQFEVVFQSLTLFRGGIRVTTNDVILHEDYNSLTYGDDIAIITMPWVDYSTSLVPINLPVMSIYDTFENAEALVAGYGRTPYLNVSDSKLMYAFVKVISNEQCSGVYGDLVTDKIICSVGQYGEAGPSHGDDGGALHINTYSSDAGIKNVLLGVISFGIYNRLNVPYVHTRVSAYIDWIQQNLNN